ncbi:MAG: hypothetical protein KBC81_01270 [Candidatus Pacebacteria bacterium]|nr:hypothetical protein [Candidatus Paceibacterota bacterium]
MSSTKIINVLKDDSFQEIMDLFKATSADEVIFVLPKSAKAFKKEDHFASLKDECRTLGKSVSFLCSSPELNEMAKKYKFDVLLARAPVSKKVSHSSKVAPHDTGSIDVVNEIESFYAEPAIDSDSISTTAMAKEEEVEDDDFGLEEPVNERRLDDIFVPEVKNQHSVKVSGVKEKAIPVDVAFDYEPTEHHALQEIRSVWSSRPSEEVAPKLAMASWFQRSRKTLSNFIPKASSGSRRSNRPTHRVALVAMACVAVVILGIVVFVTTGKAQVTIKPASQTLDVSINVFASDSTSAVNLANLAVPGQLFNIPKSLSQDFPATGHVDVAQKARGTITVYNELTSDQQLIATTRFESSDHHIFHTLTSINVPASKTVGGKLIPGSKDVQVIADKAGSEYNVAVGLFTVPAFKEKGDTNKFAKIYGQSTTQFLGGTSGQSTVVTDSDLSTAKKTLTDQLTNNIKDDLNSQISGLKILNDSQIAIGDATSTSQVDAKANTFKLSLTGSLKTVGFKESDIQVLVAQYIDSQKNMTVLPEKLTIVYENPKWDDAKNGLSFTVHITGPGYSKVDKDKIVSDLLGKNDADMKAYLSSISGISSAHVSLSPFWVRSIPKSQDKVRVELSY